MPHAAHEAALDFTYGEKRAGGFGARSPGETARPFGGHRFRANRFGDDRDDLVA
jgi:hypothetical protein